MGTTPPRLLVVDDEEVVRTLCTRLLSPLGYVIDSAGDAAQALACIAKARYDLVLTDYAMPGDMNGIRLAQSIRQQSPQTRIIFMTAFPAIETTVEMIRLGAADCLIKPFNSTELLNGVKTALDRKSTE